VATQTGDDEVDFVAIVMTKCDGFVREIKLAMANERGILRRFTAQLGRGVEFEVLGGDTAVVLTVEFG
jgi:hypothetical protein